MTEAQRWQERRIEKARIRQVEAIKRRLIREAEASKVAISPEIKVS